MRRQLIVNGALLALALGTLGVVWSTRETPTTQELASRQGKLFPTFRKDAVSRLVLAQAGRELVLEPSQQANEPGEFRIVRPWPERADVATVNQLLGSLELASALRTAEGVSTEQAGLGAGALRIRLEMAGKSTTLSLGGPAPSPAGARYAEVEDQGAPRRYVVSLGVATELSLPFDKFREPRLLEYGRSELARLELEQKVGKLELEQGDHGAFFTRIDGARELASRDVTERVLTALSRLATEHFVEAEEARRVTADWTLRVKLQVTDKSVPPLTLTFGPCPGTPGQALLLREQAGKAARAGCVPDDVTDALRVSPADVRLQGPFAARPDEVEELRVTRGSSKLELARKDKAFVLRSASNQEVALNAGNDRISAIIQAKGERASGTSLAELGLEPAAGEIAIQITGATQAAQRAEQVLVGKPRRDGSVCLKRNADAVVLCFAAETAQAFEPDPTLLKGLTLFSFAPSQVASLSVEATNLRERVVRHEDGSYELEEPKGFKHDGALVADVVQTLGALRAIRWVAAADEPSLGLASPRLRVKVELTSGAGSHELSVGAPTAGGFFARSSADPGVFVLPGAVVRDLSAPLIDRTLLPLPAAELTGIQLEKGARRLQAVRSQGKWQSDELKGDLLDALLALRAEFAVHLGPAKPSEGFATPSLVVRFTGKDDQARRLLVGANDTLNETPIAYARLDGVDATFALSGRTATTLRDAASSSLP